MKLIITCLLFLALAFVQVASASSPNDDLHEVHRYLTEEEESECVLYLMVGPGMERWKCRFTKEQAEELGIPEEMPIEGVKEDFFQSAISGGTVMKFKDGAFVKQASANKSLGTIMVSRAGSVEVEDMSDDDPRHYSNTVKVTGNFRTLVVRIIDGHNKEPESAKKLRKAIFTNSFNMKTQYKACSHGQMTTEEAGIVDVKVKIPLEENTDIYKFADAALAEAEKKHGGRVGLAKKYDLVMFCYPPGKGFGAFAPMNKFDSYYQHLWYNYPSVQMHEIGHNLGLDHSTKDGQEYGDRASIMGNIGGDEGPHCFNPAHNYQLRWYENQQLSIKPMELSSPQTFVLNGIDDYKVKGSTDGKLVVLRLAYNGNQNQGWDFYVGYNRGTGINSGTKKEFADTVTVVKKLAGGQYGPGKTDRWNLSEGEKHTISRPEPNLSDVYIDFKSIQKDGKDAIVVISNSGAVGPNPNPTPTPQPTSGGTSGSSSSSSSSSSLSCEDVDFELKGKKKKCQKWVWNGKKKLKGKEKKKVQKKCGKKVIWEKKVWDYCRETCALVDMGPCA
eukprot:jgi/Psemu1/42931/gm1.42931_g